MNMRDYFGSLYFWDRERNGCSLDPKNADPLKWTWSSGVIWKIVRALKKVELVLAIALRILRFQDLWTLPTSSAHKYNDWAELAEERTIS